ncbi:S-DNA-T family DNA segregation ATPase FtsK/SpoIIIE [Paenibacillus shirakamiensis]|uniref:S-DNA-T family DNA segregation ATPase FtsK/SpoIIIE n=1 Tax=Paenibacillus shirakamiensis TaxID=1265935 RepID=A0ABS4JJ86_9BACL|nr:DNA translocase FtsK [Paenibacillus shirakamiensis]MBP2001056.1 S-DNA-T family DNA segregation ATPase FtsK/SpoIIIE [Paenibacillus shirakamiensis]
MATKRKKKKATMGNVLKYEIYGIILITLSIIALSGEAAVGRTLFKMAAMVLGKFYFVIPLIGIYVGLAVMIHRKWPSRWSSRKTGLVLLVMAFALMSTITAVQTKLVPTLLVTPGNVLTQIHQDITYAFAKASTGGVATMFNLDISGGYVGSLEFIVLYMLFGMTGVKLLLMVMFAISFMLITNLSYVDLFVLFRKYTGNAAVEISKKIKHLRPVAAESKPRIKAKAERTGPKINMRASIPDDDDEDYIDDRPMNQPKRKAGLFQLLGYKEEQKENLDTQLDETDMIWEAKPAVDWNDLNYSNRVSSVPDNEVIGSKLPPTNEPPALIIRDFFDQIQRDDIHTEDDPSHETALDQEPVDSSLISSDDLISAPLVESNPVTSGTAEETIVPEAPKPAPRPYKLPPFKLLAKASTNVKAGDQADYMQTARKLEATLESFGVRAKVLEVVRGPAVTRYEIQPDIGVKVSRIVNLTDDIALALAAKDIRMEAPIPGKSAIGIEVPNGEVSIVTMREVMETATFQEADAKLSIAFGRDIAGQTIVGNLAKMPHLLVAGATGSGKSVCINGIITSILYKAKPDEVKFLMVDPKMVELNMYNGIPHLLAPVVTDPRRASLALKKIVVEMEKRYELFSKSGARNVEGYNNMMRDVNASAVLPYIVVIVDELADLMMVAANDVEDAIARLAQMARAAGIHLIIATQRPSVDVITGVIKANIPSRIAFGVSSQVDSRTILDMGGAEKLLGRGDMLFMPMGASKPIRVQGAFMSDQEVENIVEFVRAQGQAEYDESLIPEIDDTIQEPAEQLDELYDQAVQIVLEAKQASVSLLQRKMRVGYTRAARLIDSMEARGIVGPYEGSKPREVLTSMELYRQSKVSS